MHLNLAYRWFCRLDLTDRIPDHSTFSMNRHGRFRESDLLRHVFETTVARCMKEGLVGGHGFAVDTSLISADVQKQNSSNPEDWAARKGPAFFAYSDNYLIDTDYGVIMDVDASRSNKTSEVGAMRKMLDRTEERFGVKPDWISADTAHGSSDNLVWLTLKRQILPFIPVFDKGEQTDGTFSRSDFTWDNENDRYICPGGEEMRHTWRTYSHPAQHTNLESPQISGADVRLHRLRAESQMLPELRGPRVHQEKYEAVKEFARQCTASEFNPKAQAR